MRPDFRDKHRLGLPSRPLLDLGVIMGATIIAATPAGATTPTSCIAKCVSEKVPCQPELPPKPSVLKDCAAFRLTQGQLRIIYRREGHTFDAVADTSRSIATIFKQFPPDPCSLGEAACQQAKLDAPQSQPGGHGLDERAARPGGVGEPCLQWLPCGEVVVPADKAWTIRLKDESLNGNLQLSIIRAASNEAHGVSLPIVKGRIAVPAGLMRPATVYGYQLMPPPASGPVSGEFSVAPGGEAAALRGAVTGSIADGKPAAEAWLSALVENELEWNILQLLAPGGEAP